MVWCIILVCKHDWSYFFLVVTVFFGFPKVFIEEDVPTTSWKFLPPIKNHPIPDAWHMVIGILTLLTFISVWMVFLTKKI